MQEGLLVWQPLEHDAKKGNKTKKDDRIKCFCFNAFSQIEHVVYL